MRFLKMHYRKILFLGLSVFVLYTAVHWYHTIKNINALDIAGHPFDMAMPLMDFLQGKTEIVKFEDIRQYGPGFFFTFHPLMLIGNLNWKIVDLLVVIFNTLCISAIIFMLWKYYAKDASFETKIFFSCIFLNFNTILYVYEGKLIPEAVEITLILGALWLYTQKKDMWCALLLAYVALVKFLPLFLIFLFIFIRRRIFYLSLMWLVILTTISRFLYGPNYGLNYLWFIVSRPILARDFAATWWESVSFKALVAKLFTGFRLDYLYNIPIQPQQLKYVSLIHYFSGFIFLIFMLQRYYRLKLIEKQKMFADDFLLATGSICMVLFSPICVWEHYTLSLPAWFLAIKYLKTIIHEKALLALFTVSIVLVGIVIPFSIFLKIVPINAIVFKLIPSASHLAVTEQYKYVCLPTLGILCLVFMWFFLRPDKNVLKEY